MRFPLPLALIACWAGAAGATSSHQVTHVKAIKQGGVVTGTAVTMRFTSQGHRSILVGLGYPHKNSNTHSPQGYMHVRDPKLGYIIQELGTLAIAPNTVLEHTFKFRLGQGNDLKVGDRFEVYSFWDSSHLFGSNRYHTWSEPIYEVPGE